MKLSDLLKATDVVGHGTIFQTQAHNPYTLLTIHGSSTQFTQYTANICLPASLFQEMMSSLRAVSNSSLYSSRCLVQILPQSVFAEIIIESYNVTHYQSHQARMEFFSGMTCFLAHLGIMMLMRKEFQKQSANHPFASHCGAQI